VIGTTTTTTAASSKRREVPVESFKRILVGIDLDRCRTPKATSQEVTAQINLDTAISLAYHPGNYVPHTIKAAGFVIYGG
jgi:hypothetical protein